MAVSRHRKTLYTLNSVLKERINVDKYRQEMTAAWINDLPDDALPVEDVEEFDERFRKEYVNKKDPPISLLAVIEKYKKSPPDVKLQQINAVVKPINSIKPTKSQSLAKPKVSKLINPIAVQQDTHVDVIKKLKLFENSVLSQAFKNLHENPLSSTTTLETSISETDLLEKIQVNSVSLPVKSPYDTQVLFQRRKHSKNSNEDSVAQHDSRHISKCQDTVSNSKITNKCQNIALELRDVNKLQNGKVGAKNFNKLQDTYTETTNVHKLQNASMKPRNAHKVQDILTEPKHMHKLPNTRILTVPTHAHKKQVTLNQAKGVHKLQDVSSGPRNLHKLQDTSTGSKYTPKWQEISPGFKNANKKYDGFTGTRNVHKLPDMKLESKNFVKPQDTLTGNVNKVQDTCTRPQNIYKNQEKLIEPRKVTQVSDFTMIYKNVNKSDGGQNSTLEPKIVKKIPDAIIETKNKNIRQPTNSSSKNVKQLQDDEVKATFKHKQPKGVPETEVATKNLNKYSTRAYRYTNKEYETLKHFIYMNKCEDNLIDPKTVQKVQNTVNEPNLKSAEKEPLKVKKVEENKLVFGNINKIKEIFIDDKKPQCSAKGATNRVKKVANISDNDVMNKFHNVMAESILGSNYIRKPQNAATKDKILNRLSGGKTSLKIEKKQDVLKTTNQVIMPKKKLTNVANKKNKLNYTQILEKRNLDLCGFSAPYKKSYKQYDLIGKISAKSSKPSTPTCLIIPKSSPNRDIPPNNPMRCSKKKPLTRMGYTQTYLNKLISKTSNKKPSTMTNLPKRTNKTNKTTEDKNDNPKQSISKKKNTPTVSFPLVVGQPINKQKTPVFITGTAKKNQNPNIKNSPKTKPTHNSGVRNTILKNLQTQKLVKKIGTPRALASSKKNL